MISTTHRITPPDYYKRTIVLIIASLLVRIILAVILELGNDECYYWLYSQKLQWNYFDHPPMVAIWIRLSTLNGLLPDSELFVRGGSLLASSFATIFIFHATSLARDRKTGWIAACLFTASLYAGLVCGVLIMPDSPQLFFWTFSLLQLARIIKNDKPYLPWLLFGISTGLCIMSKIHGLFIPFGVILYMLAKQRTWLRLPAFYWSYAIMLLTISPILFWNLANEFVTWNFHSARVTIAQEQVTDRFWIELLDQIIATNPFCFVVIVAGLVSGFIRKKNNPQLSLYNFIGLPFLCVVLLLSAFRDIWFHWSGPAFISLLTQAACWLTALRREVLTRTVIRGALAFFCVVIVMWPLAVRLYPGTYGNKQLATLGQGDITLDKFGWKKAGIEYASLYDSLNNSSSPYRKPIVCFSWWGAHSEYYFARPINAVVIGIGEIDMLHQYSWLNAERIKELNLDTVINIESSIEKYPVAYQQYYQYEKILKVIPVLRNGQPAGNFYIRQLWGKKENIIYAHGNHVPN